MPPNAAASARVTGSARARRRAGEWGLRALLVLLVVDVFIVVPPAREGTSFAILQPVIHSIVLVSGIAIAFRSGGIIALRRPAARETC